MLGVPTDVCVGRDDDGPCTEAEGVVDEVAVCSIFTALVAAKKAKIRDFVPSILLC